MPSLALAATHSTEHPAQDRSAGGQEYRETGAGLPAENLSILPFKDFFFKIAKSYIDLEICFLQFLLLFGHFLDHIEPKYRPTKNGRYTNLAGSPGQGDREAGK